MQNTKNQARSLGIHARHNPTNDKTVSDDLQNASSNIVAPPRYRLTKLGEQMARLPIDPKIARILLAAKKHDCMAEILVIASALSIQDPRERPLEVIANFNMKSLEGKQLHQLARRWVNQ